MEQKNVEVPLAQQRSPVAVALANYAVGNPILKERTGLLNNKDDIQFFRFKRFSRALLSDDYKKKHTKFGLPPIESEQDAQKAFVMLIQNQMILPVQKLHYAEVKQVRGWKPNKSKPTLRRTDKAVLEGDVYFAWTYAKPNPYIVLYSILAIVGVFTVILFPLWPNFMKRGVWYLSMGMLGLIGLFFAIAIVRLIIYIISVVALPKPFWLFPNLFADCGVIESFQPLYGWEEPKKKKGKKGGKIEGAEGKSEGAVSEGTEGKSEGTSTGAETSGSLPQERKVLLEEVDE